MFTLISFVFATILLYAIVNYLLHRFNRHTYRLPPGPKPWPIVGNLPHIGPVPHHTFAAMAHTYGPLIHLRLGSVDVVVACSASVSTQFLKIHDAKFSNRPPNSGAKYIAYNYHDMVFAPYGPRWRMLRKISAVHIFSVKALDDYRHVRQDELSVLLRALASTGGSKAVNLGQLINACIANTLGRILIGRKVFNDSRMGDSDPMADEFKSMVVELMVLAGAFNIGDYIPALEWLDIQGVASKMKKLHNRFDAFFSDILEEHKRQDSAKRPDLLSTLLSLKESDTEKAGGKLTDTEMKAVLLNMFSAGTDTSLSVVEWLIAELIRHPKIMAKLQEELDTVVGRDRIVSELNLPQLPYLQAVVKEALRLHPSTPLSLPRMSTESCEINGFHIPKGSTLLVHIYAIARDPEEWVDPLQFKPERFLPGGDKAHVSVTGNHFELIPFGAGRRICVGMSLGWRMSQILTATLVHAFEWDLPAGLNPEELNMDEEYGLALQKAEPLKVHPRPRLPSHLYSPSSSTFNVS